MKKKQKFHYAIIGTGAAGYNLALAFLRHPFFVDKRILLLEKESKTANDRTWCYWEKGSGNLDEIVSHQWEKGNFFGPKKSTKLNLKPYQYKMVRGADFYAFAQQKINASKQFFTVQTEVKQLVETENEVLISTADGDYFAEVVFDSRPPKLPRKSPGNATVLQHFLGWEIETEKAAFTPEEFTMMDYRDHRKKSTSFHYILPFSKNRALVEFTLFSPDLLNKNEYETHLRQYIEEELGIKEFNILDREFGVIPMTDFPFHRANTNRIKKVGTAGGWVKPSSGYAFKNCEKYSSILADGLAQNKAIPALFAKPKFRFYDAIFLDVLMRKNQIGPKLFERMYTKNSPEMIFKFLDEETNLAEDFSIMKSFPKRLFLRAMVAAFKRMRHL